MTMPHATATRYPTTRIGGGLAPAEFRAMTPITMPTSTATIHAPMNHRVVIDLLISPPGPGPIPLLRERGRARGYLMSFEAGGRGGRIRTLGPRFWSSLPASHQRR